MHHVCVQIADDGRQFLPGIPGGIHLSQCQPDQMGNVLVLVRHFEGEVTHLPSRLHHQSARQVVQKVRLPAVRLARHDDEPADVRRMKHPVGQWPEAHIIPLVETAVQHVQHLLRPFLHGDDVVGREGRSRLDDAPHGIHPVGSQHIGNVLAVGRQVHHQTAWSEVVRQFLDQGPSRQVRVAAQHHVIHRCQPRLESLESLVRHARSPVGHTDDMSITRFQQAQHILFALGDDETVDDLILYQQRIDAVDVIGSARRGRRVLVPVFQIHSPSLAVLRASTRRLTRTVLHVHGLSVHIIHIRQTSAVGAFRIFLFAVRMDEMLRQASQSGECSRLSADTHIGQVFPSRLFVQVRGFGSIRHRLDGRNDFRLQPLVVRRQHPYLTIPLVKGARGM